MADYEIPPPEPKEIDEQNWMKFQHFLTRTVLRGEPNGTEKCGNCLYYLDADSSLTYCWHPEIRILVGAEWWCQWWEAIPVE
jgi:hypothetical protein